MADRTTNDRRTRVASGFPRPEDVPGPTERLRELHKGEDLEPRDPAYGRASLERAATDDHVALDDMISVKGKTAEATMDSLTVIANRVAEHTAAKLREELMSRGIPERARAAGLGLGELGAAGVLGAGAAGALIAAMVSGLSSAMPVWAASLITAGVLGGGAAGLAIAGRRQVREPLGLGGSTT